MEIKDTKDVIYDNYKIHHSKITKGMKPSEHDKKKWVAVDELIKEIEILKDRFGARPKADKGEKQDRFISYLDLLNSLSNENKKEHYNIGLRSPINEKLKEDDKDVK